MRWRRIGIHRRGATFRPKGRVPISPTHGLQSPKGTARPSRKVSRSLSPMSRCRLAALTTELSCPLLGWRQGDIAQKVGESCWSKSVAIVGVCRRQDGDEEGYIPVKGRRLVATLLV